MRHFGIFTGFKFFAASSNFSLIYGIDFASKTSEDVKARFLAMAKYIS